MKQYNEAEVRRLPYEGAFELGLPLIVVFMVSALVWRGGSLVVIVNLWFR